MKMPKIRIDPSQLRHGFSGNTWRQWGLILLAFLGLYALLAGYLSGMLFAALGVRQDNYRTMPAAWFGPFDRTLFTAFMEPLPSTGGTRDPHFFNRPDGCVAQEIQTTLPDFADVPISKPSGVLECSNGNSQFRWTVYPWVTETNGLGAYPGCSNAEGSQKTQGSYLTQSSSPAAADAASSTNETAQAWVCQNGVPNTI